MRKLNRLVDFTDEQRAILDALFQNRNRRLVQFNASEHDILAKFEEVDRRVLVLIESGFNNAEISEVCRINDKKIAITVLRWEALARRHLGTRSRRQISVNIEMGKRIDQGEPPTNVARDFNINRGCLVYEYMKYKAVTDPEWSGTHSRFQFPRVGAPSRFVASGFVRLGAFAPCPLSFEEAIALREDWTEEPRAFRPWAVANAIGRQITVWGHPAAGGRGLAVLPRTLLTQEAVLIIRRGADHYEPSLGDNSAYVPPSEDSFLRAVLMGLHQTTIVSPEDVEDLRRRTLAEENKDPRYHRR